MATVTLESVSPTFAVRDMEGALRFYETVLGFSVAWSWGVPAQLAAVCRDNVQITLATRPDAQPQGTSRVYLRVSGIEPYYEHIEKAGGNIIVPMGDRAYGMRDFRVADPSGNQLDIGQPLDEQSEA